MESPSPQEDVAAEVRAWLARKRRSARSLAAELGWSQPYMQRRINGEIPFNVADLTAIAQAIDVPVTVFFGDADATAADEAQIRSLLSAAGRSRQDVEKVIAFLRGGGTAAAHSA